MRAFILIFVVALFAWPLQVARRLEHRAEDTGRSGADCCSEHEARTEKPRPCREGQGNQRRVAAEI